MISNLDIIDKITDGNDDACALVPADERQLGRQRPVAVDGVQVRVAHARVLDVDQHLVRPGLLDRDLLVLDGPAGLFDHLRPLLFGDVGHVGDGQEWGFLVFLSGCLSG